MRIKTIRVSIIVVLLLVIVGGYFFQKIRLEVTRVVSEDPRVWGAVIDAMLVRDKTHPVQKYSIVFLGSSSIRFWSTLSEDMEPLNVVGRGFGGAKINDVRYYADQLISSIEPSAVVVYVGNHDMSNLANNKIKSPDTVITLYRKLILRLKEIVLFSPIYVVALKPTLHDRSEWPYFQKVNERLHLMTQNDNQLHFIDANPLLLNDEGELKESVMSWDGVHMNKAGYKVWGSFIRQRLLNDAINK